MRSSRIWRLTPSTSLTSELRTRTRVVAVEAEAGGFRMKLDGGQTLTSPSLIAATGSFGNPSRLPLPGYFGRVIHAAEYLNPDGFEGERVAVVGGGNSAVQIADELAGVARVSLATRKPIRFVNQEV
ncbi:NAD(P)-binding domain-containing protein [Herbidospora solisilvae]|uniref:NAD(P)-binding domain-containing protein n=1 Tax=Herbidospora solisilvae TaxID=2696284 RepID=UPI001929B583|nr:NAD(P)-binding domain-containing protein [Herbidospora solisilvae]